MRFTQKKESYDQLSHNLYHQRLQNNTKAQKEVDMEMKLSKFTNFKSEQDKKIEEKKEIDEEKIQMKKEMNIQELKSKAQRIHAFNQTFEQEGIEKWKQNMLKKKEAEKKELDFQLKEAEKYQSYVNKIISNSKNETIEKINNFEKNLTKLQSETAMSNLDEKIKKNFVGLASVNCEAVIQKIQAKIIQDQNAKRERDRRRRKIIVDQSKAQLEIENKNREEQLTQKLYKMSNQEKQLHYDTYRVDQNKKIIIENRKLRDDLYEEKKKIDIIFNQKNQKEFLKYIKNKSLVFILKIFTEKQIKKIFEEKN